MIYDDTRSKLAHPSVSIPAPRDHPFIIQPYASASPWRWKHRRRRSHARMSTRAPALQGRHSATRSSSSTSSSWSSTQWAARCLLHLLSPRWHAEVAVNLPPDHWLPAPKATDFPFFLVMPHFLAAFANRP